MDCFQAKRHQANSSPINGSLSCHLLRRRLRQWQQVRTWARLIREAENLWYVDVKDLRRLGALELSQLLEEVPPSQRRRVNRWLNSYAVSTRCSAKNSYTQKLRSFNPYK